MKKKPADWTPLPEVYRRERERESEEIMERRPRCRPAANVGPIERAGKRQSTRQRFRRCRTAEKGNARSRGPGLSGAARLPGGDQYAPGLTGEGDIMLRKRTSPAGRNIRFR